MNKKEILPQQVVPGKTYSFSGDIKNGCYADGTPRISDCLRVRTPIYH